MKPTIEGILDTAIIQSKMIGKEFAINKAKKEILELVGEEEIEKELKKWEKCSQKGQCCSSCIEDKEMGYGDDIDTCCCRHNDTCNVATAIKKLWEGK